MRMRAMMVVALIAAAVTSTSALAQSKGPGGPPTGPGTGTGTGPGPGPKQAPCIAGFTASPSNPPPAGQNAVSYTCTSAAAKCMTGYLLSSPQVAAGDKFSYRCEVAAAAPK